MHKHHSQPTSDAAAVDFEQFSRDTGERVRRALVAYYGVEIGTEAAAEATVVAWQRWNEVAKMANPAGFLFRVGQSKARPHLRWSHRRTGFRATDFECLAEPVSSSSVDLLQGLAKLRPSHRAAVLLVRGYGYSYRAAAAVLGETEVAVTNNVRRGMTRLRNVMQME